MEDYIVIILTLIILIIGAVGRKKPKNGNQPTNSQPFVSNNPWSILDDLGIETEPVNMETVKEPVLVSENLKENPSYSFKANEEGGSFSKNETKQKQAENLNVQKPDEVKKKERFSLRKAVIYSEILNRKYT